MKKSRRKVLGIKLMAMTAFLIFLALPAKARVIGRIHDDGP